MRDALKVALFLPWIAAPGESPAQIYLCKDVAGHTVSSDRLLPECENRPVREIGRNGITLREIPPPLTPEQKHQLELQEEKRKAEQAAADEQRRNDRLIRLRFRSEADIEAARKRTLEPVEEQIKRENSDLAAAERQQQSAQAEIDILKKKNALVPPFMQRNLDDAEESVNASKRLIRNYEAEMVQVNAKYDATLKRFRELGVTTAGK